MRALFFIICAPQKTVSASEKFLIKFILHATPMESRTSFFILFLFITPVTSTMSNNINKNYAYRSDGGGGGRKIGKVYVAPKDKRTNVYSVLMDVECDFSIVCDTKLCWR